MSDDDEKDATRLGGAPPVVPKLPGTGARPSGGEATQRGVPPPVLPSQLPQPGRAPTAPAPPPAEAEETIAIGQAVPRAAFSLQRVEPPGHTGVVYLTGQTYLLGRKQGADLPLFSPTASREHARLERRADGWYLEPCPGKTVIANGSMVRGAIRVEHKMRLKIGGDELIFFDESRIEAAATPVRTRAVSAARFGRGRWIGIGAAVAAVGAALAWWALAAG